MVAPDTAETESAWRFARRNPDALLWDLGLLTDRGLGESRLSAIVDDDVTLKRWQKAARAVRALTRTGTIAVNPITGAQAPIRWHRFTEGAHHAFTEGLAILPVAGNSRLVLPDKFGAA